MLCYALFLYNIRPHYSGQSSARMETFHLSSPLATYSKELTLQTHQTKSKVRLLHNIRKSAILMADGHLYRR
jgi:hypothetical protein